MEVFYRFWTEMELATPCSSWRSRSSIRDRVITVAMFGPLNEVNVVPLGEAGQFPRGSYFFREKEWSKKEMADVLFDVASRSIHFYFAKHGAAAFETAR